MTTGTRGFRLTNRDKRALEFINRHGLVAAHQIGRAAFSYMDPHRGRVQEVSDTVVYRRLKKLVDARLLNHRWVLKDKPGVYSVTAQGARLAEVGVPPAQVDLKNFEHDLAVVDLALEIEGLPDWFSERQIETKAMSSRRRNDGRMGRGGKLGRIPDALLVGFKAERLAIELEISGKENIRYKDIFQSYAKLCRKELPGEDRYKEAEEWLEDYVEDGGLVDGVIFYFFSDSKRERAERAASEVLAEYQEAVVKPKFYFGDASQHKPPPWTKWDEQEERRRLNEEEAKRAEVEQARAAEARAAEAERRRQEERRHAGELAEARSHLTEKEQNRALEDLRRSVRERGRGAATRQEYEGALVEALRGKREREEGKAKSRTQRKETLKSMFGGFDDR